MIFGELDLIQNQVVQQELLLSLDLKKFQRVDFSLTLEKSDHKAQKEI